MDATQGISSPQGEALHEQQGMQQQQQQQQQSMQQQGYVGFGMDPNWGGFGQQMHGQHQHQHQHGYLHHGGMQPGTAMDGTPLIPGLTATMDPLEAVLGPFPCARLHGLPFEATLEDVLVFFQGLVVIDVVLVPSGNHDGLGSGEAFVVFANPMDFQMALQRDHQSMGRQYVEVFQGKRPEYYAAIASQNHLWQQGEVQGHNGVVDGQGGENLPGSVSSGGQVDKAGGPTAPTPAPAPSGGSGNAWTGTGPTPAQALASQRGANGVASEGGFAPAAGNGAAARGKGQHSGGAKGNRGGMREKGERDHRGRGGGIQVGEHTGFIRMRGLPFSATKKDIYDFFKDYKPIESSITLTYRSDGRATGEGYIAFKSAADAKAAMALHRSTMGSRYIELFISNKDEHARSVARSNGR